MAEVEQQKIINSLDRIIKISDDINDKLQKMLDLIQENRTITTWNDGPIMFSHKVSSDNKKSKKNIEL